MPPMPGAEKGKDKEIDFTSKKHVELLKEEYGQKESFRLKEEEKQLKKQEGRAEVKKLTEQREKDAQLLKLILTLNTTMSYHKLEEETKIKTLVNEINEIALNDFRWTQRPRYTENSPGAGSPAGQYLDQINPYSTWDPKSFNPEVDAIYKERRRPKIEKIIKEVDEIARTTMKNRALEAIMPLLSKIRAAI